MLFRSADIERELKRKLERLPLPELGEGRRSGGHSHRSASHATSGHASTHKPSHSRAPAKTHSHIDETGFDFSKPYEPQAPSEKKPEAAAHAPSSRSKHVRPTAALLGGIKKSA